MPHECTDCGQTFADGSKEMLSGCPNCGGTTFQFRPKGANPPDETPPKPPDTDHGVARTVGNAASTVRKFVTGDPDSPQTTDSPEWPTGGDEKSDTATGNRGHARRDADDGTIITAESDASTESESSPGANSSKGSKPSPEATPWPDEIPPDADDAVEIGGNDLPPWPDELEDKEDTAQSSARSDIVHADELPDPSERPRTRPPVPDPRPLSARPEEQDADESFEITDAEDDGDDDTEASEKATHDPGQPPTISELRDELNDQFESIRVLEPGQYELNLMELYDREEYIIALKEDGRYSIQLPERWNE